MSVCEKRTFLPTPPPNRKEPEAAPVLHIRVSGRPRGFVLPSRGDIAERICHEAPHALERADEKTYEKECDTYCPAEEAGAALERGPPAFPIERDVEVLRRWVTRTYPDARSGPKYVPVGQTFRELARKAGIEYADDVGPAPEAGTRR